MSQFKLVSRGTVIETKPDAADVIKVYLGELLYDVNSGNIGEYSEKVKGNLPSVRPGNVTTEHEVKNYVDARWKRFSGTNQVTAPDVYQGMEVLVYQYGDSEDYFWDQSGREPGLKGREDVIIAYSNVEGGGKDVPFDLNSAMYARMNTKEGYAEFRTPDNAGEICFFQVKFNMKTGVWSIIDGEGNSIIMNAGKGSCHIKTNELFHVDTKHISLNGESYELNVNSSVENIKDTKDTITPIATYSKDVTIMNLLNVIGGITSSGGAGGAAMVMNGDTVMNGNTTINGDLTTTGTATGWYPGPKS